jgi:hypothetical protein
MAFAKAMKGGKMRTLVREPPDDVALYRSGLQAPAHLGRERPSILGCDEAVASLLVSILDLGTAIFATNGRIIDAHNARTNKKTR